MIHSGYVSQRSPFVTILDEHQIQEIIQAAFFILECTGCKVSHPEALAMLKKAGAGVDGELVRVKRHLIEKALADTPKGFRVYTRDGEPAIDLWGRKSYFGTSTASPQNRDMRTNITRPTTLQDIAEGARLADKLENIDFVMPFGTAQDVPAHCAEIPEFLAVIENTAKPVFFCGYSAKGVEKVLDLAAHLVGGKEVLSRKPFVVPYPEPITPLHYPAEVVGRMMVCCDYGVPQIVATGPMLGMTGPVTMAGAVALGTAEALFSILLAQLRAPGSPCFLTCTVAGTSMRNGLAFAAHPEMSLALGAQAEISRFLGLPTWGLSGATDAKTIDAQAGAEAALSALFQALAGVSLIHDAGYVCSGMACSPAMMVLTDEIISWVKRVMKGLEVTADTLALEIIDKVGPTGNFLANKHTLKHFKTSVWDAQLFCKDTDAGWISQGALNMEQKAGQRAVKLVSQPADSPLPEKMLAEIRKLAEKKMAEIQL
jgi:trimethylamine--corrinoid protein Co-methyltransferase